MGDKNTYYQKNREKLLNREKEYESQQEINIGNYITNKNIKKENMEEIDIKICLKKINTD